MMLLKWNDSGKKKKKPSKYKPIKEINKKIIQALKLFN
jgi:hypothetical protein